MNNPFSKVSNKISSWFSTKSQLSDSNTYLDGCYLWGTVGGVIDLRDVPEEYLYGVPDEYTHMLDVKISNFGEVFTETWYFTNFDEPYEIVKLFEDDFNPIRLDTL